MCIGFLKAANGVKGYSKLKPDQLLEAGTWLSACEQRAVKSERQLVSIKKARFLESKIGEEFEGYISSVARFGVFVSLRLFDVDGLIKIEELGGDRFDFDEENLRLVGRRSGYQYKIGDSVRIQVAAADHENGHVDFTLANSDEIKNVKTSESQSDKKRRPAKKHSDGTGKVRLSGRTRKNQSKKSGGPRKSSSRRRKRR